jgi:hypothetical protein
VRDEILRKLEAELNLPLESERQVVYLLVEIRKLMDRDGVPDTKYQQLRLFCNWAVHADLSNTVVKHTLGFLNSVARELVSNSLTPEQKLKCSEILSLDSAHGEFLEFIRAYRLNLRVPHVFQPLWWASLLRQYVHIIADCPLIFRGKDIGSKCIKTATITGYEVTDTSGLGSQWDCIFELQWIIEFENGLKRNITIPLACEKATFGFGRSGGMGTRRVTVPKAPPR